MKRSELVSVRDTIQSIWVAIILAFVLRAFMLEAFEIPTGSMAPQLMGRHAELTCADCGYSFPRGVPERGQEREWLARGGNTAECPNCGRRWAFSLGDAKSGDRVLVLKMPRIMRPLERWDVVVFKDVQGNQDNFIKRLVGLPGEVVRIIDGDIFVHPIVDRNNDGVRDEHDLPAPPTELTEWRIARKPYHVQKTMWQMLFDNDYQPRPSRRREWTPRWIADPRATGWRLDLQAGRVFQFEGDTPQTVRFGERVEGISLPANPYNDSVENRSATEPGIPYADLKIEATLLPKNKTGGLLLTLGSRGREFAAEVRFDGQVRLMHRPAPATGAEDSWEAAEVWQTGQAPPLSAGRPATIALTHADWRVTLWVDGEAVLASSDSQYRPDVAALLDGDQWRARARPSVSITGLDGAFQLWHIRVLRDVFFTSPTLRDPLDDYLSKVVGNGRLPGWGTEDNPLILRKFENRPDYDEFYMLGDNSPSSHDSRLWTKVSPTLRLYDELDRPRYRPGTVPRYNLIGTAFFVYWPAGTPLPGLDFLPIVPDVGKMRRIK